MAPRAPVGTTSVRGDNSEWLKTQHGEDWKEVKGPSSGKKPSGGPSDETSSMNSGWAELQRSFGLDGHLPHETVHPTHVAFDTEGNTDIKPVLTWKDGAGNTRHSYTNEFHRDRARALRGEVELNHARLEAAYEILAGMVERGEGGDAAAVAMLHLSTGHRVDHLLRLSTSSAAVAPAMHEPDDEGEIAVEKSAISDYPHPHRVHLVMPHQHGHVYVTSHVSRELAKHIGKKLASRPVAKAEAPGWSSKFPTSMSEVGKLFECSAADVASALDGAGAGGVQQAVVRHHAMMRTAADLLSKHAPVDCSKPGGLEQLKANINSVSADIAGRYGHHPAPQDMAYIPPSVVAAYVEASGGAALWPAAFADQEVSKSCSSATPDAVSSNDPSLSLQKSQGIASPSTPATSAPPARTPSPSPTRSLRQLSGRPWHEVADEVEVELRKSGDPIDYDVRLPPDVDDGVPAYLRAYDGREFDVIDGVRLKAEVAGKILFLTFTGETEAAMRVLVAAEKDEDKRTFILKTEDFGKLTDADYRRRMEVLEELAERYQEEMYGVREKEEIVARTTPGPQFGDEAGVEVKPPSKKRKEYPFVGTIEFQGLTIDVENRKGDTRSGVDDSGRAWSSTMHAHYGELRSGAGSVGMDDDHLDVYVGEDPDSDIVVIVNQRVPETGELDEQKVMLGFSSVDAAISTYKKQYDNPGFYGGCIVITLDDFKSRVAKKSQSGKAIEKSLTSMKDVFDFITGLDDNPQPPSVRVAFNKAVNALLRTLRRFKAGKATQEELDECYSTYDSAQRELRVSVEKSEGGGPGPEGEAVGTISTHADGEQWVKESDGWHDMGTGAQSATESKKDDEAHSHSVSYEQTAQTLARVRQSLENVSDPKQRAAIKKQIEMLRARLATFERAEKIGHHTSNESKAGTQSISKAIDDINRKYSSDPPGSIFIEKAFSNELRKFVAEAEAGSVEDVIVAIASADTLVRQQAIMIAKSLGPDGLKSTISGWRGE